ncbi:hypothetical protein JZ751_012040 [Albula glossodonta]|uniref:Uncharacterized protein n=1 Tax=Albula glossodonta TaxID=121402 RepID=A0A8T2PRG1_9TELE|nr:hypothetical protein JZ751_012040 [Albula glossodonta]
MAACATQGREGSKTAPFFTVIFALHAAQSDRSLTQKGVAPGPALENVLPKRHNPAKICLGGTDF